MKNFFNLFLEFFFIIIGFGFIFSNSFHDEGYINNIAVVFLAGFCILLGIASIVSGSHFDRILFASDKYKSPKLKIINITILSDNQLLKIRLFRSMIYCGAIFFSIIGKKPIVEFVGSLIEDSNFLKSIRKIDYVISILSFFCTVGLFVFLILTGLGKYF